MLSGVTFTPPSPRGRLSGVRPSLLVVDTASIWHAARIRRPSWTEADRVAVEAAGIEFFRVWPKEGEVTLELRAANTHQAAAWIEKVLDLDLDEFVVGPTPAPPSQEVLRGAASHVHRGPEYSPCAKAG